jgi:hypothetical protein
VKVTARAQRGRSIRAVAAPGVATTVKLRCVHPLLASTIEGQKRRPEWVNGSLKFFSKLSTAVPKSTPKGTQNKCYENSSHRELRDLKDISQITRNPTQKPELESETDCEPRTVHYSTTDSPLQYCGQSATVPRTVRRSKKLKTNFAESVLFSTEK